jgi:hypothetical protein
MSEERIKSRWVRYVIRGEGKPRSDANERYAYKGEVLYSNTWPAARLVQMPDGNWACLSKTGTRGCAPVEWKGDGKPTLNTVIYVPCVGVFSEFDGDMLPPDKLHERMQWLFLAQSQACIDKALVWPADKLLTIQGYRSLGADELKSTLRSQVAKWNQYSLTFKLGWPGFPDHYYNDLMSAIASREKEYLSPQAEAQRTRQKARKEAKIALGL